VPPLWKFILLCLLFAACTRPSIPPLSPGEAPFHREIIGRLKAREAAVRTLSGMARVVINNLKIRFVGTEVIHLEAPDRLHLEIHDPLGGLQMLLVAKKEKGALLFPAKSSVRVFSPQKKNLYHFLGVNLTVSELIRLLAGMPPLPLLTPEKIRSERDGSAIILSFLKKGRVCQRIRMNGSGDLLRWDRLDGGGTVEESLLFGDFREVKGMRLPFRIRLEVAGETLLSLRYQSILLNRPLDPGLFQVPPVLPGGGER